MGKASKSTRKFAASGQLKTTIQNRKKHQQILKKASGRRGAGGFAKPKRGGATPGDAEPEEQPEERAGKKGKRCVSRSENGVEANFMRFEQRKGQGDVGR